MHYFDQTFPSHAYNLACDEALLDLCEDGTAGELLRFWEPQSYFVVLGSSNKVQNEIHLDRCQADGIPILRRHSGGGTVLQGPGCLNYSLVLRITSEGPTRNITDTTNYIMQRHADVFSRVLGERVEMKGSSDLTIADRKFSGNAQRRKLRSLLFHGTFLLAFDLPLIEKYLKMPPKQPNYRAQRRHLEFVRNVAIEPPIVKAELIKAWSATGEVPPIPIERINSLVDTKYALVSWNMKL